MTGIVTYVWIAILLSWVSFAVLGHFSDAQMAALAGLVIGVGVMLGFRETIAIRGLVAVLEPVGVVLPLLALRHMVSGFGLPSTPFSTAELLVFLLVYVAFLAAFMGVIPGDVYRWGYAPLPVGAMVLVLCVYGAITGNLAIPVIAVAAQLLWVLGWGSSNWFDHILHATLVPVVIVVLAMRLIG